MEAGVDEVGPDLERLHTQTAARERHHQRGCDGGLSDTVMGSGNDNSWDAHQDTPEDAAESG